MSIYALSDLHGNYELFKKIEKFLKPEDIVYFLGDAADRGKDGWKIIKEIAQNKQFIYLKGNHELMLQEAMLEYFNAQDIFDCEKEWLLYSNGGEITFADWMDETERAKAGWYNYLKNLPFIYEYVRKDKSKIILTHAGCNPKNIDTLTEYDAVWNREHIQTNWDSNYNNYYIVHGHTTIPSMKKCGIKNLCKDKESIFYANGHKICIDAYTVKTNKTILLNLDNFEEKVFEIKSNN